MELARPCLSALLIFLLSSSVAQSCNNGSVRLTVSRYGYGAVELCFNGTWGSICSDFWNNTEASVVCRQLGYSPYAAIASPIIYSLSGLSSHHNINFNCAGSEENLLNCSFNRLINYSCPLNRDANVFCQAKNNIIPVNCTDGEIRLVGGSTKYEGRVEVCINRGFGTVCGLNFDSNEANIVCRQIGAIPNGLSGTVRSLGFPQRPVAYNLLGNLSCSGTESNFTECNQDYVRTRTNSICRRRYNDAAVRCEPFCTNGSTRLNGGTLHGRVEVCINRTWWSICPNSWSYIEASVVCKQFGFSKYGAVPGIDRIQRWPIGLTVRCAGDEDNVFNCTYNTTEGRPDACIRFGTITASVSCQNSTTTRREKCTTGDIRLVGGKTQYEGLVQVCINQHWGTVCGRYSSSTSSRVICHQLGYQRYSGLRVNSNSYKSDAIRPRFLAYLGCRGLENSVFDCSRNNLTVSIISGICRPNYLSSDMAVSCEDYCTSGDIRIVGGITSLVGRVEVCINRTWGTICSNYWDTTDARVVCKQLGYSPYGATALRNSYTDYRWPSNIIDLNCVGDEMSIWNCSYNRKPLTTYCSRSRDASVVCQWSNNSNVTSCKTGEVRLVGGQTRYEGRVEVCIDRVWGTVCGRYWDTLDSNVVCKQLGHIGLGSRAYTSARTYGKGTGPIHLSSVGCSGHESTLLSCRHTPYITSPFCTHSYDAGVKCEASCENGTVRLYSERDSYFRRYGRVQVCINNTWGTVCDKTWDDNDASVVCRMLGYSPYGAAKSARSFTEGIWPMYIRELNCTGSEDSIWSCPHNNNARSGCTAYADASVVCELSNAQPSNCSTGELRLRGGSTQYEGRVEMCYNGLWGSICDYDWSINEAHVVCNQLGYQGRTVVRRSQFGPSDLPVLVLSSTCSSFYNGNLSSCSMRFTPPDYCHNYNEVGVICEALCTDGEMDYDASSSYLGHVRVCINGTWSLICAQSQTRLDTNLSSVLCSSLGYSPYGGSYRTGYLNNPNYPYYLFDVVCNGSEKNVLDCQNVQANARTCYQPVTLYCQKKGVEAPVNCSEGEIRLYGGDKPNEGTLHICHNNVWNSMCFYNWPPSYTNIVCKELGYTEYYNTHTLHRLSDKWFPITSRRPSCRGTPKRLSDCVFTSSLSYSGPCTVRALNITCSELCVNGSVRLTYPNQYYFYGHVQVCIGGVWGSICRNRYWDNNDASVLCKQLGFSPYGAIALSTSNNGDSSIIPVLSGLNCTGNETSFTDCVMDSSTPACSRFSFASLICPVPSSKYSNCTDGEVRLVGGSTEYEGTVHICLNHAWGTVYTAVWNEKSAQTVCNVLGYTAPGALPRYHAYYGRGTGPVLFYSIRCNEPKQSIFDCAVSYTNAVRFSHQNDAGVECQQFCNSGDIRIAPGTSLFPTEGIIEVCINRTWGTICDRSWNDSAAAVVCRQLGYSPIGATVARGSSYIDYKPFHIGEINCTGSEETIFNCSLNYTAQSGCSIFSNDARVKCIALPKANCTAGSIRLVGGSTPQEGLVQVCYNNHWGEICPISWGREEAHVVCRQLGLPTVGAFHINTFGKGYVLTVNFTTAYNCQGNEASLLDCPFTVNQRCNSNNHAGVHCEAPCTSGDVRLRNNRKYSYHFGRVEVCVNGTWGTICSDGFDDSDASVVCKQLGYSPYGALTRNGLYPESVLPHNVYDITCNGDEDSLLDCTYSTEQSVGSTCRSNDDAAAICQDSSVQYSNCTDDEVQLVNGPSPNEGTLQICRNGVWGVLCYNRYSLLINQAVCNELGFQTEGASASIGKYSDEPILYSSVSCRSTEKYLSDCTLIEQYGNTNCGSKEIIAVRCHQCTDGEVRIVQSSQQNYPQYKLGRVEICVNGSWGTICSDFFDNTDASVICRQLGYSPVGAVSLPGYLAESVFPFHIIDLNCTGDEESVWDCPSNALLSQYSCNQNNDAALSCLKNDEVQYDNCTDGQIRLSGGSTLLNGRAEICYNNVWFGVCPTYQNLNNNNAFCRNLGYAGQGTTYSFNPFFKLSVIPYDHRRLSCSSTENNFTNCQSSVSVCSIYNSVYLNLNCQKRCKAGDIRLSGQKTAGRIEVCVDEEWRSICQDSFTNNDASVVCRQLGYSPYGSLALAGNVYPSNNPFYFNDLNCTGSEESIWDCPYSLQSVKCRLHANVICQYKNTTVDTSCSNGDVRLVGGANELEGLVEICYNKMWGSICGSFWNANSANVVCNQLGYHGSASSFLGYFGEGLGPTITSHVSCSGRESSLLFCSNQTLNALRCGLQFRANIRCEESCDDGDVRLNGSNTDSTGRVELCIGEVWTTVCHQNWDLLDARVICRQLGYSPYGAVPTYNCFTEGQLSFGITDIHCNGTEDALLNCSHSQQPVLHTCRSHEDAGVNCQEINSVVRSNCSNGDVRLVGGSGSHEGRVEVCINEAWGSICSNGWDDKDADIVCKQLGFLPIGARVKSFGPGSSPIFLSDLYCIGSEDNLLQCHQQPCRTHNCTHANDAGVVCERPCSNGDIRLGDDNEGLRGRVEVCVNMSWYTICHHGWSQREASVVCHQLGYSKHGVLAAASVFDYEWPVGLYNLRCNGSENSIWDCNYTTTNNNGGESCDRFDDASVFCIPDTAYDNCTNGDVRLVGGRTEHEGNVQFCSNNTWSSVCHLGRWSTNEARVVCRQLHYYTSYCVGPYYHDDENDGDYGDNDRDNDCNTKALYNNFFNTNYTPVFLYSAFSCRGYEKSLIDCRKERDFSDLLRCSERSSIAGVRCSGVRVCPQLPRPGNGSVTVRESVAYYFCSRGFRLNSTNNTRRCQENGTWSGQSIGCDLIDCGELPKPDGGTVAVSNTRLGGIAQYRCQENFALAGVSIRRCLINSSWSDVAPACLNQTVPDNLPGRSIIFEYIYQLQDNGPPSPPPPPRHPIPSPPPPTPIPGPKGQSRRKRNSNSNLQLNSHESFILGLLRNTEGVHTVNCSIEHTNRVTRSSNLPVTCNITTYSMTDSSQSIATTVYSGLQNSSRSLSIAQSSIRYGIGGFCEANVTESQLYGINRWPKTGGGSVGTSFCQYGRPPFSFQDRESPPVRRDCLPGGRWSSPNYTLCRDRRPYVRILSNLGPTKLYTVTVNEGQSVGFRCIALSVTEDGATLTWYNPQGVVIPDLHEFIEEAFVNETYFSENTTISSFKRLFTTELGLQSYYNDDYSHYISPDRSIRGTYVCQARNFFGNRSASLTINVKVPEGKYSAVFIRGNLTSIINVGSISEGQYKLAVIENTILNRITQSKQMQVNCRFAELRPEDKNLTNYDHIDCAIKEYPPSNTSFELGQNLTKYFNIQNSTIISRTGFCDYNTSVHPKYGNYTWPESYGGASLTKPCPNNSSISIIRHCLTNGDGWGDIDYTPCREIKNLSQPFKVYIRFSSNLTSIIPSGNSTAVLDNIRIIIELAVPVRASCEEIDEVDGSNNSRIECIVTGTMETAPTDNTIRVLTSNITSALVSRQYTVLRSTATSEDGFCNAQTEITASPDRGRYEWAEARSDTKQYLECTYGPKRARATRYCLSRGNWSVSNTSSCATALTLKFRNLRKIINEFNITIENVEAVLTNLSTIVNATVEISDQSKDNLKLILTILQETGELFTDSLDELDPEVIELIVTSIINIIDDVEEWPLPVIQPSVNIIIQSFEAIAEALVTKRNFTNITISSEDIILRGERITRKSFTIFGRKFTVNAQNNDLNVVSGGANENGLAPEETASISVPSSIIELIPIEDNINLIFIVYNNTVLFPIRPQRRRNSNEASSAKLAVGSQVVGFSVPGIVEGTELPDPVNVSLRLANPLTGTLENVSNPTCVFWDFDADKGRGNWSTRGCQTIVTTSDFSTVTCQCNHLTNFACLVDISARTETPTQPPVAYRTTLEVLTIIGVIFSLLGLALTAVTYLIFKKLRERDASKFHVQFCIALFLMLLVFISGIDKISNKAGCITVGVFIHYFALVTWMWMGAEALLMFQKLVIVFSNITWRFHLITSIICWALPLLPVVITLSVDPEFYITYYTDTSQVQGFCFLSNEGAFFGAFLVPILLLIIFNVVIYILIIRVLVLHYLRKKKRQSKDTSSMSTKEILKLMLSFIGIMSLFGLSWVFAVFTFTSKSKEAAFAAQLMFTLFNVFQGFFVFIFFVVLNNDSRMAWKNLFMPWKSESEHSKKGSSSKATLSTTSRGHGKSSKSKSSNGRYYNGRKGTLASNLKHRDPSLPSIHSMDCNITVTNVNLIEENDDEDEYINDPAPVQYEEEEKKKPSENDEVEEGEENEKKHLNGNAIENLRIERKFTIRNTHQIEKAELDFKSQDNDDDDDDDDDETTL